MSKKVKAILSRVFKRGHPEVYGAVKDYAEKKGLSTADVIASATAAYLAADAEGKEELEQAMKERRTVSGGGGSGIAGLEKSIELFNTMCKSMGTMFTTMNEARSSLQASSLVADYKAVTEAASQIKKLGGESGSGSLDDTIATIFLEKLLGGKLPKLGKSKKKTGKSEVKEVDLKD